MTASWWRRLGLLGAVALLAWGTPGVLATFTDSEPLGANTFTTAACFRAEFKGVQQGLATSSANGTTTVTIAAVDPAKAYLLFNLRSNSNRPVGSVVRGRIAGATTLEFARSTDEATPATITIQWYVVEYVCGVRVQRGETTHVGATVNVAISPVAAVNQAFVTWSKNPTSDSQAWDFSDTLVGELTSTSNLQFRPDSQTTGTHTIWWQVVEYAASADISVQKGSTSLTGGATSTTVTLPSAVDPAKTFVLVDLRSPGGGADVGARLLRARLTTSTTITIDRAIAGDADDLTEIVWQAVQLNDGSRVQHGSAAFAAGVAAATATLTPSTPPARSPSPPPRAAAVRRTAAPRMSPTTSPGSPGPPWRSPPPPSSP